MESNQNPLIVLKKIFQEFHKLSESKLDSNLEVVNTVFKWFLDDSASESYSIVDGISNSFRMLEEAKLNDTDIQKFILNASYFSSAEKLTEKMILGFNNLRSAGLDNNADIRSILLSPSCSSPDRTSIKITDALELLEQAGLEKYESWILTLIKDEKPDHAEWTSIIDLIPDNLPKYEVPDQVIQDCALLRALAYIKKSNLDIPKKDKIVSLILRDKRYEKIDLHAKQIVAADTLLVEAKRDTDTDLYESLYNRPGSIEGILNGLKMIEEKIGSDPDVRAAMLEKIDTLEFATSIISVFEMAHKAGIDTKDPDLRKFLLRHDKPERSMEYFLNELSILKSKNLDKEPGINKTIIKFFNRYRSSEAIETEIKTIKELFLKLKAECKESDEELFHAAQQIIQNHGSTTEIVSIFKDLKNLDELKAREYRSILLRYPEAAKGMYDALKIIEGAGGVLSSNFEFKSSPEALDFARHVIQVHALLLETKASVNDGDLSRFYNYCKDRQPVINISMALRLCNAAGIELTADLCGFLINDQSSAYPNAKKLINLSKGMYPSLPPILTGGISCRGKIGLIEQHDNMIAQLVNIIEEEPVLRSPVGEIGFFAGSPLPQRVKAAIELKEAILNGKDVTEVGVAYGSFSFDGALKDIYEKIKILLTLPETTLDSKLDMPVPAKSASNT